jgi:hypothetical protein
VIDIMIKVLAMLAQRVVVHPAPDAQIGEEDAAALPGGADEARHDLLAARRRHVDGDAALALVEAGPEQASALLGHRPAPVVEAAADAIEADHVRAHLREGHARERRGDEGRPFDDSQPFENLDHRAFPERRERLAAASIPASAPAP